MATRPAKPSCGKAVAEAASEAPAPGLPGPARPVHFERAWLDPASGKVFCLSSRPSKEAVLRVHDKAGHPTEEI
jgi:hypothetical protein